MNFNEIMFKMKLNTFVFAALTKVYFEDTK